MKGADIGIINFLPMPHNTYGLPNKPFEYMTCSLPVIMSNFPYWQSFFENKVLYCRPDQPSDIAAKINYLLKNSEQRKKMIIECKNMIIKKWNWKTQGDKLIKLYQKLLE